MLKPLLLSGWFRVRPFVNYCGVLILVAPLVGVSVSSTLAKQLDVARFTSGKRESHAKQKATTKVVNVNANESKSTNQQSVPLPVEIAQNSANQPLTPADNSNLNAMVQGVSTVPALGRQSDLIQRLKNSKIIALGANDTSTNVIIPVTASKSTPASGGQYRDVTESASSNSQTEQIDPIGSPHPIPWKWITATQDAIAAKGGSGIRYYRSLPVMSPDKSYAVYSRVQLEVKREIHNSRVTSVLFLQDTRTKQLRVVARTSFFSDPLLKNQVVTPSANEEDGSIGVLVPVSWSEKGDRFLARKFEAVFNTADATDQAVIWERQHNNTTTVAPAQEENDREKMAVLLGWSKSQPDSVLFRTGELGEENWPLVKVSTNGKTEPVSTNGDQPITFGEKVKVWGEPQVASR